MTAAMPGADAWRGYPIQNGKSSGSGLSGSGKSAREQQTAPTRRCLLITGGTLTADFAASVYRETHWDLVIAADAGLRFCEEAGIFPDHIVGDFDSLPGRVESEQGLIHCSCGKTENVGSESITARDSLTKGIASADTDRSMTEPESGSGITNSLLARFAKAGSRIHRYRPEKDDTDTQIGVRLALDLRCSLIRVLGGTGTRLDHVLGNLQVMEYALKRGGQMVITDPHNRVTMHASPFTISRAGQWGKYVSLIPWGGDVAGITLSGFKYPLQNASIVTAQSLGISNEITEETAEVTFTKGILVMVESKD